jgi:hypothetical protein
MKKIYSLFFIAFISVHARAQCPGSPTLTTVSQSACVGSNVTLSIASPQAGYTYSWTPATGSSDTGTSYTIVNLPKSPSPYLINVVATNTAGCTGPNSTATITINPLPTLTINPISYTLCNGGSQTFTVTGASTYTWLPSATLTNANTASPIASPSTTTVYSVTGTNANGCVSANAPTTTVVIVPPPNLTLTASAYTICEGSSQTFSVTGAGNYSWAPSTNITGVNTANPIASPSTSTVYTVTGVISGCIPSPPLTVTLTINPAPVTPTLSGSLNPLYECQGSTPFTFSLTTVAGVTPIWHVGTNTVTTGQTYTPYTAIPGTIVYSIIDSSTVTGCTSAAAGNVLTVTLTISPAPASPTLSNSMQNPLVECQGATAATVSLVATSPSVTPVWYAGTSTLHNGSTYTPNTNTPGTFVYTISDSVNVPNGCTNLMAGNALTVTVTINPAPSAPTFSGSTQAINTFCQSSPKPLTVNSGTNIALWYDGNNVFFAGSSYTPSAYSSPGTYTYSVMDSSSTNYCKNSSPTGILTLTVIVNPAPATPTLSSSGNPLTECQGASAQTFSLIPHPSIVPIWYAGTSVIATGNTYIPSTATPGATIYTISDSSLVTGCTNIASGNTLTVTVTVIPAPTVNVSGATIDSATCGKDDGGVSGINVSGGTTPYFFSWSNGSNQLNLSNVSSGTYSFLTIDANGCFVSVAFTVPGWSAPSVNYVLQKDNSTANTWDALPNYSASINHATWYWGDGSSTTGLYPSHTYAAPGLYKISVSAFTSCGDSASYFLTDSIYRLAYNSINSQMVYVNVLKQAAGINQLRAQNLEIQIYPNPGNGNFTIETNSTEKQNLQVFDITGKPVLNQTISGKANIDMGTLADGLYNISIFGTAGSVNKRLMIVR